MITKHDFKSNHNHFVKLTSLIAVLISMIETEIGIVSKIIDGN